MTPDQIKAIKKRRERAEAGVLTMRPNPPCEYDLLLDGWPLATLHADAFESKWAFPADKAEGMAEFIIHAGADIDALLEEITRLRRHLGEIP